MRSRFDKCGEPLHWTAASALLTAPTSADSSGSRVLVYCVESVLLGSSRLTITLPSKPPLERVK